MRRFLAGIAALALLAIAAAPAAASATTTGTWSQYPTGASAYSAQVQQPINLDGSSNWPSKSKGGIPIMFSLSSGTGAAVFQSIGSDTNTANDFAYMSFSPSPALTFSQITNLSATYAFASGNCHGGSLRWEIDTAQGNLFIYYGAGPNFTDCTTANQSGTNMLTLTDARFDTSQIAGGTFYDTYANALVLVGGTQIQDAALVLDGGWGGDQILTAGTTATVNDNTQTWDSGGGAFTSTCDLPAATLKVTQTAGATPGVVDETTVVQNFDTGNAFRTVDCKYQYVIRIPSLKGAGTYKLEIQIGGVTVGTAYVDLK
jgi:hypothetical protein